MKQGIAVILTVGLLASAWADPQISSWFTTESTKYARVRETTGAPAAGSTTWTGQTLPAYAGIQEIAYDANYVYARSFGLAGYVMGPWYLDANKTMLFPNRPLARTNSVWRFTRTPAVAGTKTLTALGAIGLYVNGVSFFDNRDGFFWSVTNEAGGMGVGFWYRDAWVNESVTFDTGYAHQEQTGNYHYHAYPPALRYQLGDNIILTNGFYTEATGTLHHSPILAWAADGFPVYGPYGYSDPNDAGSPVRRMVSGYVIRDGQFGTDDLRVTGRATIPAWAQRAYNTDANHTSTNVVAGYPLGRYLEDNDYLGDHGYVQGVDFDLNEWNSRFCVTPEYPGGTWAYFCTLTASNTPAFPYAIGRQYLGTPQAALLAAIPTNATTVFKGGPSSIEALRSPAFTNTDVTLVWSSIEGGTYKLQASADLSNTNNWTNLATNIVANAGTTTTVIESGGAADPARFYRVSRVGLAGYYGDGVSTNGGGGTATITMAPNSGARGTTFSVTATISSAATPTVPAAMVPVSSFTVGTTAVTSPVHASQYVVTGSLTIPGGAATGPQTVTITFPPPPGQPSGPSYTQTNGFTVN